MNKLLLAVALWVGIIGAGWARTVEEQLLASLQAQGYVVLDLGYTFLGRLRVVAENGEIRREIVVNPGTGEILRDYAISLPVIAGANPGSTQGAGGSTAGSTVADPYPGVGSTSAVASSVGSTSGQTTISTATDPDKAMASPDTLLPRDVSGSEELVQPEVILVDPILPFDAETP